ncbi:coiled-coil domain-containing protein 86-like [Anneissia japonica]|uniref:coiled-coil domain-containing protein 86-like n=1 Tax=Anneissia japonica TaxID=1529436 RepID=UPI00142571CC|nr:coiled-coil domain-containing protein 86-like [Anneissia japonica]XP_033102084.1 coiled-coil domain-containing protein 86-like [Anneissia japonica]
MVKKGMMNEEIKQKTISTATECQTLYKKQSVKEPKGRPKSGRLWKTEQTKRFSGLKNDKPLRSSWKRKMTEKAEKQSIKKYEQELKQAKIDAIELKKRRREENLKRKLENERKHEVVQVITNTAKMKRMKKKHLRQVEKR